MDILTVMAFAILSPILAGVLATGVVLLANAKNIEKPPVLTLVVRSVAYAIAGGALSLACTIIWMIWYERSTGYDAGNAPLGWIFFYGPASAALGQIIALLHWWIQPPRIDRKVADKNIISEDGFVPDNYPKTYQASRDSKIDAAVVGVLLGIVLPVILLLNLPASRPGQTSPAFILVPIYAGLSLLFLLMIRSTFKSRITLQSDSIVVRGMFGTWVVQRNLIRSWCIQQNQGYGVLELRTQDAGKPVRRRSLQCRPDTPFFDWFIGIDNTTWQQRVLQEVRDNAQLGATPEQREDAFRNAGKNARVLQGMAVVISLWAIVYPHPGNAPIWLCIALPWFGMLICAVSKQTIRPLPYTSIDPYNNLGSFFFMPAVALALHATTAGNVLHWFATWPGVLAIGVVYLICLGLTSSWFGRRFIVFLTAALFCVLYSVATFVLVNQLLNLGGVERQRALIVGKHQTDGTGTVGYFTVTPWGPYPLQNDIRVGWDWYNAMKIDQPVCMNLHTGLFGLQWYDAGYCYLNEGWEKRQPDFNMTGSVGMPHGPGAIAMIGTPHAWGLAAALPLALQTDMDPLKLSGWDFSWNNVVLVREFLISGWNIYDRGDLLAELSTLEQTGRHRAEFERLGQRNDALAEHRYLRAFELFRISDLTNDYRDEFVQRHWPTMRNKSLLAFDLVRVINLSRRGYLAGYLSEQEAWEHIMPAARHLQKTYSSWQDLTDNYVLGREFWGGDMDHQDKFIATAQKVLDDHGSPWIANDWDMDLR
jgi:hypothetical protein